MSKLSSVADYRREMAVVEALIRQEEETSERLGADPAAEATLRSLQTRLGALEAEFQALSDEDLPGHELELLFSGDPVTGTRIDANFLGSALKRMQALVHSLVNSQFGNLAQHGSWPEEVLRRSTMQVAQTFPGSFGVRLETIDEQLELEGTLAVQPALSDLFDALNSEEEGADYLQQLGPLGSRARGHLRAFLKEMEKAEARVELHWPVVSGDLHASIDPARARELAQLLNRIEETDRLETRTGVLEGAIVRTHFFELQLDDESVISGRVSADIQQAVIDYFGQRVEAQLLVTTVRDSGTGIVRDTYRLMSLAPTVPDGAP